MNKSKEFYNRFQEKLIRDYVKGNLRMETAISNCLKFVPINATKALDIGCGIGWSTYELARNFEIDILGVDLSNNSIDIARKLFKQSNTDYSTKDITTSEFRFNTKFDFITLIDVYEHIPIKERKNFNGSLLDILNDNSAIFLSCPSIYHQAYLKENNPKGLQPVDEDVTKDDLLLLADEINGELVYFEFQNIFMEQDYFYAVIKKGDYKPNNNNHKIEELKTRISRVKSNLKEYAYITKEGKKTLRDIIQLRTRLIRFIK